MKNTIKLLTFALACTMATQSFGMWNRLSRLASTARVTAAARVNSVKSAARNWTNRVKIAKVAAKPIASTFAARRMLYASAAGIAGLTSVASTSGAVAGSVSTLEAQKTVKMIEEGSRPPHMQAQELTAEQMQAKLDELRAVETAPAPKAVCTGDDSDKNDAHWPSDLGPNDEFHPRKRRRGMPKVWTPEAMQEKLNELRMHEDAATDKAVVAFDTLVEGTYVCKDDASKARLKLIQDNAKLLSHCLSREGTYRTEDEENNDQANQKKCADGYLTLAKKAYNPQAGNGFREWTHNLLGSGASSMIEKPVAGDKSEVSIDVQSKQLADNKDEVTSFSYRFGGQVSRNRFMQFLYRPEFVVMAAVDPTMLKVRRTAIAALSGNKDKDVVSLDLNMPFYLSNSLTATRIKMFAALKAEQAAAQIKPSHQFVTTPDGFQLSTVQEDKKS